MLSFSHGADSQKSSSMNIHYCISDFSTITNKTMYKLARSALVTCEGTISLFCFAMLIDFGTVQKRMRNLDFYAKPLKPVLTVFTLTNTCRRPVCSKQQIDLWVKLGCWKCFRDNKYLRSCHGSCWFTSKAFNFVKMHCFASNDLSQNKVPEMLLFSTKFRISAFWQSGSVLNKWTIYICQSKKFFTINSSNVLRKDSTFFSHLPRCWMPYVCQVAIFSTKQNFRLWTSWRMR